MDEDELLEPEEMGAEDFEQDEDAQEDEELQMIADALAEEDEEEDPEPEATPEPEDEVAEDFKTAENARNAERRRQNEERQMQKLRSESPEFLLAQQLVHKFGKPPEALLQDLLEAQMKEQALQQGVPVEVLQQQQATQQELAQLRQQVDMQNFMVWTNQIEADKTTLKAQYPMLDDADLDAAKGYITGTLQNTNVPLEEAVLALHGKKIIHGLRSAERNEALAEVSGRKAKSTAPPKSGKSDSGNQTLSAEESIAAKALGISEKDYLKYRI